MENSQKRFLWPLMLIVAVLVVVGAYYVFEKNQISNDQQLSSANFDKLPLAPCGIHFRSNSGGVFADSCIIVDQEGHSFSSSETTSSYYFRISGNDQDKNYGSDFRIFINNFDIHNPKTYTMTDKSLGGENLRLIQYKQENGFDRSIVIQKKFMSGYIKVQPQKDEKFSVIFDLLFEDNIDIQGSGIVESGRELTP
jgi:hypothetical protein